MTSFFLPWISNHGVIKSKYGSGWITWSRGCGFESHGFVALRRLLSFITLVPLMVSSVLNLYFLQLTDLSLWCEKVNGGLIDCYQKMSYSIIYRQSSISRHQSHHQNRCWRSRGPLAADELFVMEMEQPGLAGPVPQVAPPGSGSVRGLADL